MVHLWRADLEAAFGRARGLWAPRWRDSFLRGQHASAEPLSVAAKGLRSPANSTGDLHSPLSASSLGHSRGSTTELSVSASHGSPFVAAAVAAAAAAAAAPPSAPTSDVLLSDKVPTTAPPLSVLGSGAAAHDGADIRSRFMLAHDNIRRQRTSMNSNSTLTARNAPLNGRSSGGNSASRDDKGTSEGQQQQQQQRPDKRLDTDAALAQALAARDAAVAQACSQNGAFNEVPYSEVHNDNDKASSSSNESSTQTSANPRNEQSFSQKGRTFEVGDEVVAWGLIPPLSAEGEEEGLVSLDDGSKSSINIKAAGNGCVSNSNEMKSPLASPSAGAVVVIDSNNNSGSENTAAAGWHAARVVAVAKNGGSSSSDSDVTGVVVKFNDARVRPALSLDQNQGNSSSSSCGRGNHGKNAVILPLFLVQKLSHGSEEDEAQAAEEDDEEMISQAQAGAKTKSTDPVPPLGNAQGTTIRGTTPVPLPPPPPADSPSGKRGSAIVIDEVI